MVVSVRRGGGGGCFFFFFFNDTATTEIYTLSLHDALPICHRCLTALPLSCKCVHECDKQSVDVQQIISASCTIGKLEILQSYAKFINKSLEFVRLRTDNYSTGHVILLLIYLLYHLYLRITEDASYHYNHKRFIFSNDYNM